MSNAKIYDNILKRLDTDMVAQIRTVIETLFDSMSQGKSDEEIQETVKQCIENIVVDGEKELSNE